MLNQKKIGRYEVASVMGQGAMGTVYRAHHMLLEHDLWSRMIAVKLGMAATTAVVVFACAWALTRLIRADAVVLATGVLFAMSTFLERAAELRVDMPTSLAGLVSFVLLFTINLAQGWSRRRHVGAGR